ncbi:hypothetical protein Zmor_005644 [Zophobas morio]|uniref:Uncharacterized protein n=1 Tax=Zophobas morio TaxID=2755281 RepID=A0AA38MMF3_9CUCU|nr:hypothetical protein Zmor_005644 [Zophobas morio]
MATESTASRAPISCKKCSRNAVNERVICVNCNSGFHTSCAKLCAKVKFIDDHYVLCCDEKVLDTFSTKTDVEFFDAMDELSLEGKTLDPRIVAYMLKQKDTLIQELYEKIATLRYQLSLQKHNQTEVPDEIITVNSKIPTKKANEELSKTSNTQKTADCKNTKLRDWQNSNNNQHSQNKDEAKETKSKPEQNWTKVEKKKPPRNSKTPPKYIIGTRDNTDVNHIKAIPKKAFLYVTRIAKDISSDTLENYLKGSFPEAVCEILENKFDSPFSRFKVIIDYINLEKSQDPKLWPAGVQISRFFHARKNRNMIT